MKILLDTHAFLWCLQGNAQLSKTAARHFLETAHALFLSAASYWEICIKVSLGKLTLEKQWEKTVDRELENNHIRWLPLEKAHMRKMISLPFKHRDPFDRLLIAQALCEDMAIMTADKNISKYSVPTIW